MAYFVAVALLWSLLVLLFLVAVGSCCYPVVVFVVGAHVPVLVAQGCGCGQIGRCCACCHEWEAYRAYGESTEGLHATGKGFFLASRPVKNVRHLSRDVPYSAIHHGTTVSHVRTIQRGRDAERNGTTAASTTRLPLSSRIIKRPAVRTNDCDCPARTL